MTTTHNRATATPVAATTAGKVRGTEKDGLLRFRGIPFAAPPVGALRFRAPQPVEAWTGVRDAARFGPSARQPVEGGMLESLGGGEQAQSEDCLYLNVVTPGCDDAGRPVMVWIHGGAFEMGSGATPWYSGTRLAALDDVVVVTINYRLGPFGFSNVGALLGEQYAGSGNCGILDQVAALEWVRDNIAAFGGDPANVTVFGESAGGMSVGTLLGTPVARGLFGRAIAQSGACHNVRPADVAAEQARVLLEKLGATDPQALLDASADAVLAAHPRLADLLESETRGLGRTTGTPSAPVVDGVVLPRPPIDSVRDGMSAGVDLVAGTTADEWALFDTFAPGQGDDATLRSRLAVFTGDDRAGDVLDAYRGAMPDASGRDIWVALCTDAVFRIPAIRLLEAQSVHRPDTTFGYLFTYKSRAFDGILGACHGIDIPFVFDIVGEPGTEMFLGDVDDDTRELAAATRAAWTSFASTGVPDSHGLPKWAPYDTQRRATMLLGPERSVADDPDGDTRAAWEGVL